MANWLIALFFALPAGAWLYTKLMRSTGNNRQSSALAATAAAVVVFLLVFIVLGFVFNGE